MRPVVLIDLDNWDALDEWGSALHQRGVPVIRVSRQRRLPGLQAALDRWQFGARPLVGTGLGGIADGIAGLPVPPLDIQGPETVVRGLGALLQDTSAAKDALRKVGPGIDQDLLYDKWLITGFAGERGLRVPASWPEPPDQLPVVVKGRISAGGQDVAVARSPEEFTEVTTGLKNRDNGGVFFQETLPGSVLNASGVADRGELLVQAVYRADPDPDDPLGPPRILTVVDRPDIHDQMGRLVEALGYTGPFCIDYVDDARGLANLVDFNPRIFGGWLQLQLAGFDFLGAYLHTLGYGAVPDEAPVPAGTRFDVRMLPESASDWAQWRTEFARSLRAIRDASSVTGWRFASLKSARAVMLSGQAGRELFVNR